MYFFVAWFTPVLAEGVSKVTQNGAPEQNASPPWSTEHGSKFIDDAANAFSNSMTQAFEKAEALRKEREVLRQQSTEFYDAVMQALATTKPKIIGKPGERAAVSFIVSESGALQELQLLRSSGNRWLDEKALSAVRLARLPLPPAGLSVGDRKFNVEYRSQ